MVRIDRRRVRGGPGLHVTLDLADRSNLAEIARWSGWADVVFHLTARPGIRTGSPLIDVLRHRDIIITTEHLMAVVPDRAHVILASPSSVYGEGARRNGAHRASRETDLTRPSSRYGGFKASMERLAHQYRRPDDGLAIARPFTEVRVICADPTRARVDLGVDLTTDLERVTIRHAGARLVAA